MKLYIIGNGFDLAHGLKTSYADYYFFVEKNANNVNGWNIILEYYPKGYEFWSDAETNICIIDRKRFLEPKRVFNFTDIDLLLRKIRESFEAFIINVETHINRIKPRFVMDKESLFLTFNYTSVLEDVYGVSNEHIIHLHNTAGDAVMKHYFGFIDSKEIILGHGPNYRHFLYWTDKFVGGDKDYISFRNKTLKNTKEIIEKYNLEFELLRYKKIIDEVIFYGFSFSPNDQEYMQKLFMCLSLPSTKYKFYYFLKNGDADDEIIHHYKDNIIKCGCNFNKIEFIRCNNVIEI